MCAPRSRDVSGRANEPSPTRHLYRATHHRVHPISSLPLPTTLSSSTRAVNGRDVSRRVEFKTRFKFPREIPPSLNFAPQFDPFFARFEETPPFSKHSEFLTRLLKKEKGGRNWWRGVSLLFLFFNRYFVSIYVYIYICVYMYEKGYFIFAGNFPIFACISIFERGRERVQRVICSINALHYDANKRILTRCSELKIMHRKYITLFFESYSFSFFLFRFSFSRLLYVTLYRRINWRIITQRGRGSKTHRLRNIFIHGLED